MNAVTQDAPEADMMTQNAMPNSVEYFTPKP